jgi:carboxyl-terminal processing protease
MPELRINVKRKRRRIDMKQSPILMLVLVLISMVGQAQLAPDMKSVIDAVLEKAKQTSWNSHRVVWDSVKADMYKEATFAKSVPDLQPAFRAMLTALNDRNGKFIDPTTNTLIAAYEETFASSTPGVEQPMNFEFKILEDGIGYLKIVNISSEADVQKEAATIRTAVDSLSKGGIEKWIIDLRNHNGGNVNPVIAGIAPLLGEGQVGSVIDGKTKILKLFEIHNGNFYDDQHLVAKFPYTKEMHEEKLAVLVGSQTSGSGELVAVTLKGRRNTKFFGEPTAGNVAAMKQIEITPELSMLLTEHRYQDRKGTAYLANVKPDAVTEVLSTENAIDQAIHWLNAEAQVALTASRNPQ